MGIADLLKRENVEIIDSVTDWRDAVEKGTHKLIEGGYITHEYTEAIIENAIKYDAYFVLVDGVALLHASSTSGVNQTQLSLTYVKEPFKFEGKDENVNLMITLAAADSESHMVAIQRVAMVLSDEDILNAALHPQDEDSLYNIFVNAAE